jgi:hypothetical protein
MTSTSALTFYSGFHGLATLDSPATPVEVVEAVASAQQEADEATDDKDAAFQMQLLKMGKMIASLHEQNVLLQQRLLQQEAHGSAAQKTHQTKERALMSLIEAQRTEMQALTKRLGEVEKRQHEFETDYKKHGHVHLIPTEEDEIRKNHAPFMNHGTKPYTRLVPNTVVQIKWPGTRETITVPDLKPPHTYFPAG